MYNAGIHESQKVSEAIKRSVVASYISLRTRPI